MLRLHGSVTGGMVGPRAAVLVVDDEASLRDVLAEALESDGYDVVKAGNGAEALARLRERRPDVVVLDLMMPVLDGWAFMQTYREAAGSDIPIVGASASMTPEKGRRLRELGVRACLSKPFDLGELLDCVSHLVGKAPSTPAQSATGTKGT
jgi:CheY-like chemotaxis protein